MNSSLAVASETNLPMQIGQALAHIRESRGLNQTELAKQSSLDQAYISRLETGSAEPKFSTIRQYLRAVGADWSNFAEEMGW